MEIDPKFTEVSIQKINNLQGETGAGEGEAAARCRIGGESCHRLQPQPDSDASA